MKRPEREKIDIAILHSALVDDFGMRVDGLQAIVGEDLGDSSSAFSANLEGQRIIIKTMENDLGTYPVEVASLELLGGHGIPVAKPLGYKEKAKYLNQPIIVQTAIVGMPVSQLEQAQNKPKIYQAAGAILKRIHEIKIEGFGKLEVLDGKLKGQSPTWKDALITYNPNGVGYQEVAYLVAHGFINPAEAKQIENIFTEVSEADLPEATFLHNDFGGHHIFTDGENITGIIDMGGVSTGDPRMDIAKSHFYMRDGHRASFDQGYGELTQDPLVAKYLVLVAARKIVYRHSYDFPERMAHAVEALKQSLAETK